MKVITNDGVLVPWLQQAQDRGLIPDWHIDLDEETYQMYLEWIASQESETLH